MNELRKDSAVMVKSFYFMGIFSVLYIKSYKGI